MEGYKVTCKLFFTNYFNFYFVPSLLILVVITSLSNWYSEVLNYKNIYFVLGCLAVIIYILYCTYKISKEIVDSSKHSAQIRALKNDVDGELKLLSLYNLYSSLIEENKARLEIYKSFSPISIVVFLLGLLIKWNFNNISTYFNNIVNFNLEFNYILVATLLLFGIWYVISFRKYWGYHKNLLRTFKEVKNSYESLQITKSKP